MIDYPLRIQYLLILFGIVSFALVFISWKHKSMLSGLVLAYLMDLAITCVPGAWVYSHKWYFPQAAYILNSKYDASHVYQGFLMSCYGLIGLLCGVMIYFTFKKLPEVNPIQMDDTESNYVRRLARIFLVYGFIFNICLEVATQRIPSVNMIVAVSFKFFVIGLALYVWEAIRSESLKRFYLTFFIAMICFPLYTMVSDGFMSFAVNALIPIISMSILHFKKKKHVLIFFALVGWLGASFFVNYMQVRGELRKAVWAESSSKKAFGVLQDMVQNFESFDQKNQTHLEVLDIRLNQSYFLGLAMNNINQENIDYARGRTLNYAVIAMIPRAIWPNKPEYGGSMGIVADYSGLYLNEGTSFGVGQVMEFYINYGVPGVFIGFGILGYFIALFDNKSGMYLNRGNYQGFICWFLPGLGFLNALGLLAETVGTIWISIVTYWALVRWAGIGKRKVENKT